MVTCRECGEPHKLQAKDLANHMAAIARRGEAGSGARVSSPKREARKEAMGPEARKRAR